MPTTVQQDDQFLAEVISSTLLEDAIKWIEANMEPEDVFSEEALAAWAKDNEYVLEE